jgi:hypothetical protein
MQGSVTHILQLLHALGSADHLSIMRMIYMFDWFTSTLRARV